MQQIHSLYQKNAYLSRTRKREGIGVDELVHGLAEGDGVPLTPKDFNSRLVRSQCLKTPGEKNLYKQKHKNNQEHL